MNLSSNFRLVNEADKDIILSALNKKYTTKFSSKEIKRNSFIVLFILVVIIPGLILNYSFQKYLLRKIKCQKINNLW